MLFQVNYKYVHANGKLRSGAAALEAKDVNEARKAAITKIKEEHDHFEITSVKPFGTTPNSK